MKPSQTTETEEKSRLTTFHFQTHVPGSGGITFPPLPETFRGEEVTVKVDVNTEPKPKRTFAELCGAWGKEEDREEIDRMVAAIHEGRLLGTERESLITNNAKHFERLQALNVENWIE